MYKQPLAAFVSLMFSLVVQASIIDLGNITRDTSTGLDWLDLTETVDLTYNQVTAEMGAGGLYEGWRYATVSELDQLIINFGYVAVNQSCEYGRVHCDSGLDGDSATIINIIRHLGDTVDAYYDSIGFGRDVNSLSAGAAVGLLGSQSSGAGYDTAHIGVYDYVYRNSGNFYANYQDRVDTIRESLSGDTYGFALGSFLVAPAPVPVPAAVWLFGSALVGLIGFKRKK